MTPGAHLFRKVTSWREALAADLASENPNLPPAQLDDIVLRTIDRLLFLRECELRGIERAGRLQQIATQPNPSERLVSWFRQCGNRYDSRLFFFPRNETDSDAWTLTLSMNDGVLRWIMADLVAAHDAPVDAIIGHVYEHFLRDTIRPTASTSDGNCETRRSRGVYYTPAFVVDHIVHRTLGEALRGASVHRVAGRTRRWARAFPQAPISVLDPACGSGLFLIAAYRHLLAWYRDAYVNDPHTHSRRIVQRDGQWQLTPAERQRILLDHVHGVDIDPWAVEITRLSLMLVMLEGQSAEPLWLDGFEPERRLPGLEKNIRCGNALIGADFQGHGDGDDLPADVAASAISPDTISLPPASIRPTADLADTLNWPDAFPEICAAGGFDVVMGNPPYLNVRLVSQSTSADERALLRDSFECARRSYDLYVLFVERSFHLLRDGGRWGMIVPNKIATLDYARACRRLLLERTSVDEIDDVSRLKLFSRAAVYPYIITWRKTVPPPGHAVRILVVNDPADLAGPPTRMISQSELCAERGVAIHGGIDIESRTPTARLDSRGVLHSGTTGFTAQSIANKLRERQAVPADGVHYEFIVSGNIDRYVISPGNVRFMKRSFQQPVLPVADSGLTPHKRRLYSGKKIVVAGMTKRLEAAYDTDGLALGVQVFAVADMRDDPRYLLAILNSRLMSHLFRTRYQAKHLANGYLAVNKSQLAALPIPIVDRSNPTGREHAETLVKLVDQMSAIVSAGMDRTAVVERMTKLDRQIDRIVYELYGLTGGEIRAIESGDW